MTKIQWTTMVQVVSELCQFYDIPVTLQTVLGHGEVETVHRITQRGKWDPMVLPWDQALTKKQVGDQFRDLVRRQLRGSSTMRETPATIMAIVLGKTIREAQIFNEKSFIKLRPLCEEMQWSILHANEKGVELSSGVGTGGSPVFIPYLLIDQNNSVLDISAGKPESEYVNLLNQYGFVSAQNLATSLNLTITWDGGTRTVIIG
jgi:hypothetical protein